jgi:putative ABC transport system permease protein
LEDVVSDWNAYLRARLGSPGLDGATEADSIEELAQHLAEREAEALAEGASPDEARQAARAELTDLEPLRDEIQWRRRPPLSPPPPPAARRPLAGLAYDVRYAVRLLARNPGFALVAIFTLALGIGANGAVFSLVHGVLLKPLPFAEPDRLVALFHFSRGERGVMSPPNFLDLRAQSRTLQSAAAYTEQGYTLTGAGEPARLRGAQVTDQFFEVLGVPPLLGRALRREENQPGHASAVVLGHRLWQERFAGDRAVVGRTVILDGAPLTVVGVMPAGFAWPAAAQLWTPFEYDAPFTAINRGGWYVEAIGRLKAGATWREAATEAAGIAKRLEQEYPDSNTNLSFAVLRLHEAYVGDTRVSLLVLVGAVGFVLLIACVNVANLLLARASHRAHEIAMRAALGAGSGRLARQLLTESGVLAACGAAVGLGIGSLVTRGFVAFAPDDIPRLGEVALNGPVVVFTALVTMITALLFGAVPAWRLTRVDLAHTLKEGARTGLAGGHASRLRSALVVAETTLAVALLVGAGLLLASFTKLQRVNPGFRTGGILTFQLSLPESAYRDGPSRAAFFDHLLSRLRSMPGVRDAGGVLLLPLAGDFYNFTFSIDGRPPFPPGAGKALVTQVATPGYFRTLGIPLVRGRMFTDADSACSPQVMLISESVAREYFPNEDPIGKRIRLGWLMDEGRRNVGGEIVGIVGDIHEVSLRERQPAEVYVPHGQAPIGHLAMVVGTALPPLSLSRTVERVVHELDANLPVARLSTMEQRVAGSVATPRFYTALLAAFALVALSLAAIGVFGVLSFLVAQRTREIGIRMALGCAPGRVMAEVVGRAMALAAIGLCAGVALALPLSRVLAGLLFETTATDPVILAATVGLLAMVALAASYVPARRATRVDPLIALRSE